MNVVVVNNQSASRIFYLLSFHWMLTTTTFVIHHKIQLLLMKYRIVDVQSLQPLLSDCISVGSNKDILPKTPM